MQSTVNQTTAVERRGSSPRFSFEKDATGRIYIWPWLVPPPTRSLPRQQPLASRRQPPTSPLAPSALPQSSPGCPPRRRERALPGRTHQQTFSVESRTMVPVGPDFPLTAADLSRWTRFGVKGGIGLADALNDKLAEGAEELMFLQGDEIVVLLELEGGAYLVSNPTI